MKKYYFENIAAERCLTKQYFQELMKEDGNLKMTVLEAIPEDTKEFFWCRAHDEVGESGAGTCGKECISYDPRNGKNGRCRYHSRTYGYGNKVELKID